MELDGRKQYLLRNIFKIDQKSLSKLFITSQQTFTCSKSTREILEVDVVLMSLFLTLNSERNSHHFWGTIADLQEDI